MTIISLESPETWNVATARAAASDLKGGLIYLRDRTDKALCGIRTARTLEKVLTRYAGWLGVWYRSGIADTYAMHFRGHKFVSGLHVTHALQIRTEIQSIENHIGQKTHWVAMPNLQATRLNIQSILTGATASIDLAIESCAVLEGHQPSEGPAA